MLHLGELIRQSVITRLTRSLVLLYLNQCQLGIQISHKQSEYQTFWPQAFERISANEITYERYYLNTIKCQRCYLNLDLQKITVKRKYHICGFHMSKHNRFILTDHVNSWRISSCASQKYILFELDASKFGQRVTACILRAQALSCIFYSSLFLHSGVRWCFKMRRQSPYIFLFIYQM